MNEPTYAVKDFGDRTISVIQINGCVGDDDRVVCDCPLFGYDNPEEERAHEDAERIAAVLNACAGVPTRLLVPGLLKGMKGLK